MRHIIASGHRFELLYDPDTNRSSIRHKIARRSAFLLEQDEDLRESICGSGSYVDRELADLWFSGGYGVDAVADDGLDIDQEPALDDELF